MGLLTGQLMGMMTNHEPIKGVDFAPKMAANAEAVVFGPPSGLTRPACSLELWTVPCCSDAITACSCPCSKK